MADSSSVTVDVRTDPEQQAGSSAVSVVQSNNVQSTQHSSSVVHGGQGPQGATGPQGVQGAQGIQGEQGEQGETGATGATGAAGATWHSGSGAPGAGLGVNGDHYFRTDTGQVYLKSAGSWSAIANITGPTGAQGIQGVQGDTGATGAAGADGKTVRSGSGVPGGGLGVDGDFYINTDNHDIYGPKTAGAWGSATSLIGPQGDQGDTGATGSTGPQGDSIVWQGAWADATAYDELDAVENNGNSYICILAHTSSATDEPGVGVNSATYWELMAAKGADGAGAGDASTDTATSVDGEMALFKGTTGKLLKRLTATGLIKAASGVVSAAVAGTDYLAPAAIGVTVQAYSANLDEYAGVNPSAAGLALLDDADASAQRTTLGLGAMATKATVGTSDIDPGAVTYDKIQDISAAARILGRQAGGTGGDTEELTAAMVMAIMLNTLYPVGSLYFTTSSTNPGTFLGGTWAAFGAGRVPVGFSSGETEFDTDEETGGAKTHTLTTGEMPSHNHTVDARTSKFGASVGTVFSRNTPDTSSNTDNAGGGGAHNNLQPYIVVRMWKRTA